MSTPAVRLSFPKDGRTLKCSKAPAFFAAFGSAPVGTSLSVAVRDSSGRPVGTVKLLAGPPDWVAVVTGVPPTQGRETYTLEVLDAHGTLLACAKDLKVKKTGLRGIDVTYPESGDTVCTRFSAYGGTDETGDVSGSLYKGGNEIPGTTLQNGPVWVVSFRVGEDTYDQLEVTVNTSSVTVTNITAASSAC
jgi:hypothetical protein